MRDERPSHTLCATALVNEAYVRLVDQTVFQKGPTGNNRARFFGAAAKAMRRLLVEHARARGRIKRGGSQTRLPMDIVLESLEASLQMGSGQGTIQLVDLNEVLEELEAMDARAHDIIVMRFFGGLTVQEAATCLGLSPKTVEKDWTEARAWLRMRLSERE